MRKPSLLSSPAFPRPTVAVLSVWLGGLAGASLNAAQITAAQTEFFEGKIRPIFASHCYKCHGQAEGNKVKGGLALDSREGLSKGGNSGAAIVPGAPDKSLLITAVRYTDPDLQMPPKGEKLSSSQVADLVTWVKMGAPDPRTGVVVAKAGSWAYGGNHWAFQPVRKPVEPAVQGKEWVATPVDAFILAKLEQQGLKPSPPADKRALLRRVTFDLIGLPPTPAEIKSFLEDNSADAFAKVVDRLLASKHYGERWGRFWLDTARYSDTKGDVNKRREEPYYPYAWVYRDYVIKSFNEDKPFDRFLMEQIAADKLPLGDGKSALAGLGFLTLGDRFGGNINDIINDRIDVLTKGTLALTVACSRCHDHKFDPIPQADYYSLHGIFASSVEPKEKPLIERP
ncbi:MAG: DUF1549 domain-containing protein, partial [Pedosphaera parvula]|nr:DUF1549 domain-containing protein [Pedosphaera parvula]